MINYLNKIHTRNFSFNKKSVNLNRKNTSYDIAVIMTDHDYLNYEMIKNIQKHY